MAKILKHIEIVRTNESTLSSMSLKSCEAIVSVLKKHYQTVGVTLVNNIFDLNDLLILNPDLVFMGMKFVPTNTKLGRLDPNKIWITKFLDEHGINYTGSGYASHDFELNKQSAKKRVADFGLNTSNFVVAEQSTHLQEKDIKFLKYPLFVKPTDRGGGLGIDEKSIVNNFKQLLGKVNQIAKTYKSDSIIEEYLPGREFSVAVIKNQMNGKNSAMPLELVAAEDSNGARVLGGAMKSSNSELVLDVTEPELKEQLNELALNAFEALGAKDYGRIDIRLDKKGVPQFLEANLLPSLISGYGSFPKACVMHKDLGYEDMILTIANLGFKNLEDTDETILKELVPKTETDIHLIATA